MSTAEQRQQQRDEWHRQDVRHEAAKRTARYRRKPPRLKAGMLRKVTGTAPEPRQESTP